MVVAFTGHREYDRARADDALYRRIVEIASRDDVTFLSGMAVGFDLAAAEIVLEVRRKLGCDVKLKCIVPFSGQSRFFCYDDQERYNEVIELADEVVTLSDSYRSGLFFERNDYLVDHADYIIAYYNDLKKGGTAYTVKRARRSHIVVDNIYPTQQLSLF